MVRRRWPDAVIVLAIVALAATGVYALWGDALRAWLVPGETAPIEHAPPAAGTT